jgi:hypothetical protein
MTYDKIGEDWLEIGEYIQYLAVFVGTITGTFLVFAILLWNINYIISVILFWLIGAGSCKYLENKNDDIAFNRRKAELESEVEE